MKDSKLLFGLSAISGILVLAACFIGTTPLSPSRFFAALFGQGIIGDQIVIWDIRLPRAVAAMLVGTALGLSGAALQGLLRNPLAEPGVLGVSAMAALGATLSLFYGAATLSPLVPSIAAIIGAMAATFILMVAAARNRSIVTLILIGIGLSSFTGAVMALLLNLAPSPFSLSDLISWSLGSVANRSWEDIFLILPFIGLGGGLLFVARRSLSVLTLGESTALGLGVDLKKTRLMIIAGTGLLTGAAVSLAGAIGFVGIVAPHLTRPFTGHDPARNLLPAGLLGGILLVLADIGIRLIPTPTELRLGVVVALIGAPIFMWIAAKRGENS